MMVSETVHLKEQQQVVKSKPGAFHGGFTIPEGLEFFQKAWYEACVFISRKFEALQANSFNPSLLLCRKIRKPQDMTHHPEVWIPPEPIWAKALFCHFMKEIADNVSISGIRVV